MLRELRRRTPIIAGVLVMAGPAAATDLQVPAQYPTIQAAIAAATADDRVLVQPGSYHEVIDFAGKRIEVIGVFGAAMTTIAATGLVGSVVSFNHAEPPGTLLKGFTLTGGTGTPSGSATAGGGILSSYPACPTIRECVISGNSAGSGGGIKMGSGSSPLAVPMVVDCVISGNHATGGGGGVYAVGSSSTGWPVVRDCKIVGNQATGGGGCVGAADFVDCVIEGNASTQLGGGAVSVHSLKGSLLRGNTALQGGGYYDYQVYGVLLTDCAFIENSAQDGGGAFLKSDSPSPIFGPEACVSRCVFARNSAVSGDGLKISFTSYVTSQTTIINCSFDANSFSGGGSTEIRNCIMRNVSFSSAIGASYSDIDGPAVGPGNIDADPLWADPAGGDYHLLGCSPCIDAGDPASPQDADGTTTDMGGLAFAAWTDLGGGVPGSSGDSVLAGSGLLEAGGAATLALTNATPGSPVWLVLGLTAAALPFNGGTFWPTPGSVVGQFTDASGSVEVSATWPPLIGCGFTLYVQAWWPDASAGSGWAGSNGLRVVSR